MIAILGRLPCPWATGRRRCAAARGRPAYPPGAGYRRRRQVQASGRGRRCSGCRAALTLVVETLKALSPRIAVEATTSGRLRSGCWCWRKRWRLPAAAPGWTPRPGPDRRSSRVRARHAAGETTVLCREAAKDELGRAADERVSLEVEDVIGEELPPRHPDRRRC